MRNARRVGVCVCVRARVCVCVCVCVRAEGGWGEDHPTSPTSSGTTIREPSLYQHLDGTLECLVCCMCLRTTDGTPHSAPRRNLLIATMNDTYDRVKEFREVEVMRLRAHMMVYVKDFMKRSRRMQVRVRVCGCGYAGMRVRVCGCGWGCGCGWQWAERGAGHCAHVRACAVR